MVGRAPDDVVDLGGSHRSLNNDSHLRWLGPEKGVMHLAAGAVINAAVGPGRQAGRQAASGTCWRS